MTGRPAWVEVDLDAVRHNVRAVATRLAPGARIMAVVKANGYGHGDVEVARAALDAGATWLGVILVDEALKLRAAGIGAPILLLHEPPASRLDEVLAHDLAIPLFTEQAVHDVGALTERTDRGVRAHVKVDTGLNRLGVPLGRLDDLLASISKYPRIDVEGVFSHFAFADQPRNPVIDEQIARFGDALDRLASQGVEPHLRHLANSAACLTRPDAHFDMVRLGIAMYGLSPGPETDGVVELRPALSLKARVAMVKRVPAGEGVSYGHRYRMERTGTIATIPLGYADGWPRALSSNAWLLIRGARYPAVGTVCMDSFMADLGEDDCEVGDEVVMIGSQAGERVSADELAVAAGTINYEIVTRLSARLPRVYRGA